MKMGFNILNVFVGKRNFVVFTIILLTSCCRVVALKSFPYLALQDCSEDNYYSLSELQCKPCEQFSIQSTDHLSCQCSPQYYRDANNLNSLVCKPCPANQVPTADGFQCIECSFQNPISGNDEECTHCLGNQIAAEYNDDGTKRSNKLCIDCNTPSHPDVQQTECVRCDPFVIAATTGTCTCPVELSAGGICFPAYYQSELITNTNDIISIPSSSASSGKVQSFFIQENYAGAIAICELYSNLTACQLWANVCVMQMYQQGSSDSACSRIMSYVSGNIVHDILEWKENLAWLYYSSSDGENIVTDTSIDVVFSANPDDDDNKLDVVAAVYHPNGTFLGTQPTTGGLIQLCQDTPIKMDAAYNYGQNFKSTCNLKAQDLWNNYETTLFDPYLRYADIDSTNVLFPLPVLVTNYNENGKDNSKTIQNDWQLTRRFFLVDNLSGKETKDDVATIVRYAKSITLKVTLQNEDGEPKEGKIYPPLFIITYDEVNYDEEYESNPDVEVSFEIIYELDQGGNQGSMTLAAIILAVPALLYAALKTTAWRRRAGRLTVDVPAFMKFFAYAAGLLSDMLFIIVYGSALYFLVFYKRQGTLTLALPTPEQEGLFIIFIIGAFFLKFLDLVHLLITQCSIDIFFIDWERPRFQSDKGSDGKGTTAPVSIWRTYFVANEWNEIQTNRRSSPIFQTCAVLFFLQVIGFENVCTYNIYSSVSPDQTQYIAQDSRVLRFAMATTIYLVIGSFQWIFFTFIYERFVENSLQNFVDLCSMANVSIFVLANQKFGYYIHGRSVHGFADTDMKRMREQLKREEDNLCGQRGLLPNTEEQTFEMQVPERMREQYDRILLPLLGAQGQPGGSGDAGHFTDAYIGMNKFLSAFIDHGLRDIDYQVKDKLLLERILDMEFSDSTEQGFLYNDDGHSFDRVLFSGNEMTLLLYEVLFFCFVDVIFADFVLAAILTFLFMKFVKSIRDSFGRSNLAKKTLVDERFLI